MHGGESGSLTTSLDRAVAPALAIGIAGHREHWLTTCLESAIAVPERSAHHDPCRSISRGHSHALEVDRAT